MDIKSIKDRIKSHRIQPEGIKDYYSVLLPLIKIDGELHILYEIRSHHLDTQPGDISFPGGKVEDCESYKEAAVRETCEELNITEESIELLGELDYIISPYNLIIRVFAGFLKNVNYETIIPNQAEVENIFPVPLTFFKENKAESHNMVIKTSRDEGFPYHLIQNGRDYNWRKGIYRVYFYKYKDYVIWGLTAKMTRNFIKIISI